MRNEGGLTIFSDGADGLHVVGGADFDSGTTVSTDGVKVTGGLSIQSGGLNVNNGLSITTGGAIVSVGGGTVFGSGLHVAAAG